MQLDTVPSMNAVEQWARSLLAEMETLSKSGQDSSSKKRTRVAAITGKGDRHTPPPAKTEAKKADVSSKDLCKHWASESGCKRGRNCGFPMLPTSRGSVGFAADRIRKPSVRLQEEGRVLFLKLKESLKPLLSRKVTLVRKAQVSNLILSLHLRQTQRLQAR